MEYAVLFALAVAFLAFRSAFRRAFPSRPVNRRRPHVCKTSVCDPYCRGPR